MNDLLRMKFLLTTYFRSGRERIFVNSIPKSGTNLVVSLAQLYGKARIHGPYFNSSLPINKRRISSGVWFGHIETAEGNDWIQSNFDFRFTLVREPIPHIKSLARYIIINKRHPLNKTYAKYGYEELIRIIVEGEKRGPFPIDSVDVRYSKFCLDNAKSQIIDFEQLKQGQPSCNSVSQLLTLLGKKQSDDHNDILLKSKSKSSTFKHSKKIDRDITIPDEYLNSSFLRKAEKIYADTIHPSR